MNKLPLASVCVCGHRHGYSLVSSCGPDAAPVQPTSFYRSQYDISLSILIDGLMEASCVPPKGAVCVSCRSSPLDELQLPHMSDEDASSSSLLRHATQYNMSRFVQQCELFMRREGGGGRGGYIIW